MEENLAENGLQTKAQQNLVSVGYSHPHHKKLHDRVIERTSKPIDFNNSVRSIVPLTDQGPKRAEDLFLDLLKLTSIIGNVVECHVN